MGDPEVWLLLGILFILCQAMFAYPVKAPRFEGLNKGQCAELCGQAHPYV